jgi:hypothetical protein
MEAARPRPITPGSRGYGAGTAPYSARTHRNGACPASVRDLTGQ